MRHPVAPYSTTNENFILVGDFNTEEDGQNIRNFLDAYGLKNLVKSPTCHKSDSSTCIDLILTNRSRSFKNTKTIETRLSDFHEMIVTVFRSGFVKKGPKLILYRDYKKFDVQAFRIELAVRLSEVGSDQGLIENYGIFNDIVNQLLDKHAPLKKKHVRANVGPFMNKTLRKGQFPVRGIFRAGGILVNKKLLSRNYLFNFRAKFSLKNNRISVRSENSTDWKSAVKP